MITNNLRAYKKKFVFLFHLKYDIYLCERDYMFLNKNGVEKSF